MLTQLIKVKVQISIIEVLQITLIPFFVNKERLNYTQCQRLSIAVIFHYANTFYILALLAFLLNK